MTEIQKPARYSLFDAIRGFAVINMVLYHLLYDIFAAYGVWTDFAFSAPFFIWERFICFTFIIVSGMSVNFSKHGFRRGITVNLCGFAVTVVTVLIAPEQSIWFGVLNFLGCAMIIAFTLRNELRRIRPVVGMIIFFILFMLCYGIPQGHIGIFSYPLIKLPDSMYQFRWLSFLGFPSSDFYSTDYFPILQFIFLYLFGFELWRFIEQKGFDRFFRKKIPVLDFIGRQSLIIYMVHQPLLYGICWLIFR